MYEIFTVLWLLGIVVSGCGLGGGGHLHHTTEKTGETDENTGNYLGFLSQIYHEEGYKY